MGNALNLGATTLRYVAGAWFRPDNTLLAAAKKKLVATDGVTHQLADGTVKRSVAPAAHLEVLRPLGHKDCHA
eukprot:4333792-Lingulodinium_polyedra.AAC.1